MRSEAQKRADAAYEKKRAGKYVNVACRMLAEDAAQFKAAARASGTTPNAVLREAIEDFMENFQKND